MFKWYKDMKLGSKLLFSFLLVVSFTIFVSAVSIFSQRNTQNMMTHLLDVEGRIADLSLQSINKLHEAEQNEKAYRLQYKTVGFEEARATYVANFQEELDTVHTDMSQIRALTTPFGNESDTLYQEAIDTTMAIDASIDDYETIFLETVDLIEKRGYLDQGLEGVFRDKVHTIEDAITAKEFDSLTILMLQIRRGEKDYLLRSEQMYVDNVHDLIEEFKAGVAVSALPEDEQQNLNTLIDDYKTSFDKLVAADAEIAASLAAFEASVSHLEPLLTQMYSSSIANQEEAQTNMQTTEQTTMLLMIIVSIVVVAIGVLLAFVISQSIAGTINMVAAAAKGIAAGDLKQHITVNSQDELGQMGMAFQRMIVYMQNMADVATDLAVGDVSAEVVPQSEHDVLGNAFQEMIAYMQQMADVSLNLAEGNLMTRVTPKSDKDVLGNAFSRMIDNLRLLIGQVQRSSAHVADASKQLDLASQQAGQASQQVSATIQQIVVGTNQQTEATSEATSSVEQIAQAANGIARGAQEQAKGITQTSDLIDEMTTIVNQTGQATKIMSEANAKMMEAARHGASVVEQTNLGMSTIRSRTAVTAEKMKEMGVRSKEIGRIIKTINDIADKTDMLALNAAVEAARAGEHGRGFAVVADQVRKLSEDSKNATRDIGILIERVQESIDEAVVAMDGAVSEVDNGTQLAHDTDQSLAEILQAAEEASTKFEQMTESMAQLSNKHEGVIMAIEAVSSVVEENTAVSEETAANSREVIEAMESIVSIAEENSAGTEEVSASTEEMSAQIEEFVAAAKELSDLALDLRDSIAEFQLDEEQTPVQPQPQLIGGNNGHNRRTNGHF